MDIWFRHFIKKHNASQGYEMDANHVGIRFEHEITNQISTTFPRKMSLTMDKHSIIETHEVLNVEMLGLIIST